MYVSFFNSTMAIMKNFWELIASFGIPLHKLLSVAIVAGWLIALGVLSQSLPVVGYAGLYCLPFLGLIWFCEPLGEFTGVFNLHNINTESPPFLVAFFGWLGLLAFIVYTLSHGISL